jgi:hypothetical protein
VLSQHIDERIEVKSDRLPRDFEIDLVIIVDRPITEARNFLSWNIHG